MQGLGAWGAIAFIGLYILATILFLPGSVLTLGAGVLFGVGAGSVYVMVGATIGATIAFLIGRYLARGWVARRLAGNDKFRAIDQAIAREGLKIIFLTRLSPIIPFNLLNYALGVTQVTLKDYILGCFGMIPGTILYVYIGSLAGNLAGPTAAALPIQWAMQSLGLVATVVVTLYVSRIAKLALEQSVTTVSTADSSRLEAIDAPTDPPRG